MLKKSRKFILWFREISMADVALVGGKNGSLGEMYQHLTKKGMNVPNGFALTAFAYRHFLTEAGLKEKIGEILAKLDPRKIDDLRSAGRKIRQMILAAEFPEDLKKEVIAAYQKLSREYKVKNVDAAVRSSATAEDLPDASFAGQLESYLNVRSEDVLIKTCLKCFASLFTDRAISYTAENKLKHADISLSVGVQKMARSDQAGAGVAFTLDTESGFPDVVFINAAWGLGENVVKGRVNPDEYYVFKPTLKKGFKSLIRKTLGSKKEKLIYSKIKDSKLKINDANDLGDTINIPTTEAERKKFVLSDGEILQLAKWAMMIEDHYKKPMDIEWAKDGVSGQLYIVQARPETVYSRKAKERGQFLEEYILEKKGKVLVRGDSIGSKIGRGRARIILGVENIRQFKPGEVLVTKITDPDWEPIMKIAAAIVTDSGGRTSHAAIVSREMGIPCVVGTGNATKVLKTGQQLTVDCAEGEGGLVCEGLLPFAVKKTNLKTLKRPKTKVMMNIGEPESAFLQSFIPNDGIGLAREEFVISNYIKIHPLALMNFNKLKDAKAKKKIAELTDGYKNKTDFFVEKLAEGVAMLGAAFYPKDVIVRFSDFKTNEYANLIGGREFEPVEANPMIGWRGASRYYDPKYKAAFALECRAIKKVRAEMGLGNVIVMVPFCRTVEEGKAVLKTMKEFGLNAQRPNLKSQRLKVYVMCEIPSNVILAEEFSQIFDGFSIGSNDLTQLTLGVDRDSELVSHVFDERNAAVKKIIREVIKVAHKNKRKVGICGQAPSDFPDFAEFLVECGIDSISLNPDTVLKTTLRILQAEKRMKRG